MRTTTLLALMILIAGLVALLGFESWQGTIGLNPAHLLVPGPS